MKPLLASLMPHLMVVPILLPMVTAAGMLLLGERRRPINVALGLSSAFLGLSVACVLLAWRHQQGVVAYLPGNWPAPFGIALALDPLSAVMLVLTWVLGLTSQLFASARWHRAGVQFHPLLQLQLMGLSGSFLTADIFNLFVFFEILLAASYGLLLHGAGKARVRASVPYVAINLTASSLFLVGAAILYGVTGTLNMAELSARLSAPAVLNRDLVNTGAAFLALAFLMKAGAWPLNFWLSPAYASATPPVAAMFAVLTKVGVYALIRLWTLLFAGGALAGFGANAFLGLGVITALLAVIGMLASHSAAVQASWAIVVSSGTLLSALGVGDEKVLASSLFYLVPSTLASSVLFLLNDLIQRWRSGSTVVDEAPFLNAALESQDVNLDDEGEPLETLPFPASTALLGLAFVACTLLLAGLPPLPTFVGKVGMLSAAMTLQGTNSNGDWRIWMFCTSLILSGAGVLLALMRTGLRTFWVETRRGWPRVRAAEGIPVVVLLSLTALMASAAGPAMVIANDAARNLYERTAYIDAVLRASVRKSPSQAAAGP